MVSTDILNYYQLDTGINRKHYTFSNYGGLLAGNKILTTRAAYDEGYAANVVVWRCINLIADAISYLPVEVATYDRQGKIKFIDDPNNELLLRIKRPNAWTNQRKFVKQVFINYLTSGVGYIRRLTNIGRSKITGLDVLPSWCVTYDQGRLLDLPLVYRYTSPRGEQITFPVDQITGQCDLFAFKNYNPIEPIEGLSALVPGSASVDNHNSGLWWNASLLENSSRPGGLLSTPSDIRTEEFQKQVEYNNEKHTGSARAGKTMVLTGDWHYEQMGLSPVDMDFEKSIEMAARNIGAAFNVPHQLIVRGESTYNNYQTAMESFYSEAVLPKAHDFYEALTEFVAPKGSNEFYTINEGKIDALEPKRERRSNRISQMIKDGRLTLNEARAEDEWEPYKIPEADMPLISRSYMPLEEVDIQDTLDNILPNNGENNDQEDEEEPED